MLSGARSPALSTRTSRVNVDAFGLQLVLSNQDITINVSHEITNDEAIILALGYKQEFKRDFNSLWSVFSVSFAVLGLLPSIGATFTYQQLVAGISPIPWIIAIFFITCVALSLAEVSSKFPTSGGTPYAVSQLLPPKYAALFTWLTSFSNWLSQVTAPPSVNYATGTMLLAVKSYALNGGYRPTKGQTFLVCLAIQISHAVIASLPTRFLSRYSSIGNVCNCMFLAIVFVVILTGNRLVEYDGSVPRFNSNGIAWAFHNQTDFPSGIAVLCSFLGAIWAMAGYDAPFHLAEECTDPGNMVPKAIILTSTVGGLVGWFFMIAIAYTVVDIDIIRDDPKGLGQPFISYLTQVLSRNSVLAAASLTIASGYFMGSSCMLAASRVTYAYARDGMFPLSRWWKKVHPLTSTPVNAVWVNMVAGQLLLLLMFAGDTAIGAVFSVNAISSFVAFTAPTLLKITYGRNTFVPGPWNLGPLSTPIGWVSVAFVAVMIPILCFPTVSGLNLTPDLMNWTVVVYFVPMIMAFVWFQVDAYKWYKGPRSNIDEDDIEYGGSRMEDGSGTEGNRDYYEVLAPEKA